LPKKTLALILTLALLTALCTACGRKNKANSGSSSSSSSSMMGGSSSSMTGGTNGGTSGSSGATGGMGGSDSSGGMAGSSGGMDGSDSFSGSAGGSMSGSVSASIGPGGISGSASGSTSTGISGSGSDTDSSSGSSSSSSNSNSDSSSAAANAAAPGDADAWMTRLVNAATPLPENFSVETVNIQGYDERLFDKRAAPALESMLADAEKAGCKLYLVSGYRSVERQAALFKRKTNAFLAEGFAQDEAERQAAMWVARPGTSEHNTGLAADIVSANWYASHDDLTADFENTPEFSWLLEHCAEYGFILRYPKGKEDVTGITYEPWHYRYVGEEAAAQIMEAGSTLEEYHAGK